MSTKSIYADTEAGRLGACMVDGDMVMIWRVNGPRLGFWTLSDLGGHLSPSSLRSLFAPAASIA